MMKTGLNRGIGNRTGPYTPTNMSERILYELSILNRATTIEKVAGILSEKYAIKPEKIEAFTRTIKATFYVLGRHNKIEKTSEKYSRNIKYKIKNGARSMHQ